MKVFHNRFDTPLKINGWNMSSWRFGSDHFPTSKWVMAVGEQAVNLPGLIDPNSKKICQQSMGPTIRFHAPWEYFTYRNTTPFL